MRQLPWVACGSKSLNPSCTWGGRQGLCMQLREMKTPRRAKAGNWWLSVPGEYSAPPASLHLQKRFVALVADEGLEAACDEVSQMAAPEPHSGRGKWQVTAVRNWLLRGRVPICWPDLGQDLRRSAACKRLGSRTSWGGCWGLSGSSLYSLLSSLFPLCSSAWAAATQPGETWSRARMTMWLWRQGPRAPGPSNVTCQWKEELEEEWRDPAGQQPLLQLVSITGFQLLWLPGHFQDQGLLIGPTWLSVAKHLVKSVQPGEESFELGTAREGNGDPQSRDWQAKGMWWRGQERPWSQEHRAEGGSPRVWAH